MHTLLSVNETTGYTPNMMMLGKKVTGPLYIQFADLLDIKQFQSEFVTNLQYRIEHAYEMAKGHIQSEMRPHKRYHVSKLF